MSENNLEKKIDIYSLYTKEKEVTLTDDLGLSVKVLIVKMTQGERTELLKKYSDFLEEEKNRLRAREEKLNSFALSLKNYKKEDLIVGLITFEKAQRSEVVDFFPTLDGKNAEERQKIIEEELKRFEEKRKEELNQKSFDEILQLFIGMTIESQALISASQILNRDCLVYMCLDPITRERIFKNSDDVDKIRDRRILDTLLDEVTEFRKTETAKEVRKIASSDETFLAPGESQGA